MTNWIDTYLTASNPMFYPTVGLSLFLAGVCMPISADLVLLTVGYLAYQGQASYGLLIPVCITSILLGDTVMFFVGLKFGKRVISVWPFRKVFTQERIDKSEISFRDQGYRVVFLARFMPGIRTVFMFTSGTLGLRYLKFIAYDLAGALIVVPGMIFAVKLVAGNLALLRNQIEKGQWLILSAIIFSVVFVYGRRRYRQKKLERF
jgi:membrane protein DedA with SNARE-associated domain